jgi:hypothetical protein
MIQGRHLRQHHCVRQGFPTAGTVGQEEKESVNYYTTP